MRHSRSRVHVLLCARLSLTVLARQCRTAICAVCPRAVCRSKRGRGASVRACCLQQQTTELRSSQQSVCTALRKNLLAACTVFSSRAVPGNNHNSSGATQHQNRHRSNCTVVPVCIDCTPTPQRTQADGSYTYPPSRLAGPLPSLGRSCSLAVGRATVNSCHNLTVS